MSKATKEVKNKDTKKITKKITEKKVDIDTKSKKLTTSKKTTTKKASTNTKKSSTTKTVAKKESISVKKSSTIKKKTTNSKIKKIEKSIVAEYYDLPYRYNETIVKILYQTPNILFVYWDISDENKNKLIAEYGDNFFFNTKPILKIYNITKNYDFEVKINDFANSWYINVNDSNCEYKVELARKPITYEENLHTDYIHISSSNDIKFPNDHILLEELPYKINFKNVKTNSINTKDISTLRLIGINKIYNIYDFYKKLYKDELLEELNNKKINNSSSSWN